MPLKIEKVLVCDAVDKACVDLLQENGINVSTKVIHTHRLTEIQMRVHLFMCASLCRINVQAHTHTHTHSLCSLALFVSLLFTQVTYKLKLPLEELCKEVKVSTRIRLHN